jgi:hypothetical protein
MPARERSFFLGEIVLCILTILAAIMLAATSGTDAHRVLSRGNTLSDADERAAAADRSLVSIARAPNR